MATLKVTPSQLRGKVTLPPSKSHTMRALLFGSMAEGKSHIYGYLKSPDTLAMVEALRLLGVSIHVEEERIDIQGVAGKLQPAKNVIDAGNSGQVLRFVGSLAALVPAYTIITGDHSIRYQRPMQPLLSALTHLKAFATSSKLDGKAPIIIQGPLQPGYATLAGEDSQPVSALLIATSFLQGTTHLKVTNPGETPWIDLTLSWLKKMGGEVSHKNYEEYTITGPLRYKGFEMQIPGDFSSAAFPLVAALLTHSAIRLENTDMQECQGDKKIIEVLQSRGAHFEIEAASKALNVRLSPPLRGGQIDVNEIIDALPILAVVGCFATEKTEIINAAIARKKESDRIHAIAVELRKMGAQIEEREDGLIITPSKLKGAIVTSHADHRIGMALAVAALAAQGESVIEGCECIVKSYPAFVEDFQKMGALMERVE